MKKFVTLLRLSLMMAIAGCSSQTTAPEGEVSYPNIADGTYEGVGSGYAGDIKVSVEFKDGEITAINVVESSETLADGVDQRPQNILDNGLEAECHFWGNWIIRRDSFSSEKCDCFGKR